MAKSPIVHFRSLQGVIIIGFYFMNTQQLHPPKQQRGAFFSFMFLVVVIVAMVAFAMYVYYLNSTIVSKFENRRWDIPARVYSRPLALNANTVKSDVDTWLSLLNYQNNNNEQSGTYQKSGNTYTISTRGFGYGDGNDEPAQHIQIRFDNNKITSLKSTHPNPKGNIHLEPVYIGGIYPDSNEDRVLVKLSDTPQGLIDALIATEDRNFYEHYGISIRGTTRAILNNLKGGSMQGGSTLTQQLVKNFYLNSEKKLKRKVNEALMALLLEQHYSKNDILQAYINEINLGQNGNRSVNGFAVAAQFYFNRPLAELSIEQHALLVGLAKGPTYYNPRKHPERALERRNTVLNNMLVTGKITQEAYDAAIATPLGVVETPNIAKSRFPDFLDYVKRELNQRYKADDLKTAGLRIITTLDPIAQMAADKAMENKLPALQKSNRNTRDLQAALISANPQTGAVVALVGSGDEFTGFNRAIDAKRQVGSLLKPVIYLMALQSGEYNLASSVNDTPISYKAGGQSWTPKNYNGQSYGNPALVTALANSYNIAAVNTGMQFGVPAFNRYLKQLGVEGDIPEYPSVLLGAVDLSPMQMLGIYQVFATGGMYHPLHSIYSVVDEKGRILQQSQIREERRLPDDAAYLTNFAMQQVIKDGTAKAAQSLGNNIAGKTGTTNEARDAWFAGYSGNYVSVVWVGRDDNKPIGLTGGTGALPLWVDYMRRLRLTPVSLPKPEKVEWIWIELGTGRYSEEGCDGAIYAPILPKSVSDAPSLCSQMLAEQARQAELLALHGDEAVSLDETADNSTEPTADTPPTQKPTSEEEPMPTEQ